MHASNKLPYHGTLSEYYTSRINLANVSDIRYRKMHKDIYIAFSYYKSILL